jgi:putative transposase
VSEVILAHKIELDLTCKQRKYLACAAGCARFVWNWGLAEWNRQYKAGGKPSGFSLKKQFNAVKYQQFPWMKTIHRDAHAAPFSNLDKAFKRFFKKVAKRPAFKKKGQSKDSFAVANDLFRVSGKVAILPRIGKIRLREELRFQGKIMGAVVSRTANRWFISIQVDVGQHQKPRSGDSVVGVDLGLKTALMLSTGEEIQAPKPLKSHLRKLKRAQQSLSRKQKGSRNRHKAKRKLAKTHTRVSSIRNNWLHSQTTRLCRENQTVVIEDLNVSGMLRNRKLSRAISDIGFYEFRRQLTYKSMIYGTQILVANRWFPSSKTCSTCGAVKSDLTLNDRVFSCACGTSMDRDLNAALNLRSLADGLSVTACGQSSKSKSEQSDLVGLVEAGTTPCSFVGTL